MSEKNQPRCVVVVEPLTKEMEAMTKEPSKKKSSKATEEKKAISEAKVANTEAKAANTETKAAGSTDQSNITQEPKQESKPPAKPTQENGGETSTLVNGKKEKLPKSGNKSSAPVTNGVTDVALNKAVAVPADSGAVEAEVPAAAVEEEVVVVSQNPEADNDELFPELNYDDTSDNECNFDSSSPEFSPVGRSVTRRSQAKKIPTPETPQMSVPCDTPEVGDTPKTPSNNDQATPLREKVFKMKDMYSPMRLSPAPEAARRNRETDSPLGDNHSEDGESKNGLTPVCESGGGGSSKTESNYSKSRVRVSPYRRSARISEQYSTLVNCSTTPADISSSSSLSNMAAAGAGDSKADGDASECSQGDISVSDSFRNIKGRRSYKHLREISLRNLSSQRHRGQRLDSPVPSISSINATVGSQNTFSGDTISSESSSSTKWTPVGHVVGRKRRQEDEDEEENEEKQRQEQHQQPHHMAPHYPSPALSLGDKEPEEVQRPSKRARLLGYVASPLRQLREKMASSTPIMHRHTQISARQSFKSDPLLVPSSSGDVTMAEEAVEMPLVQDIVPPAGEHNQEGHKWCSIM